MLKEFWLLCQKQEKHDCVLDYLQAGGSCTELLQLVNNPTMNIPHILILEIVQHMILKINTMHQKYITQTGEGCRYLLSTYMTVINKSIGLNSSSKERKIVLKLLTAIVTFYGHLSKEVLLNVKFFNENLDLLTGFSDEEDSVRKAFINFLMAFLVDGFYPTISMLLERKGLLPSIINGLQFDNADTVCLVMAALKNNILQNPSFSKTAKMQTFSTPVVKDIVNLYNWKGPSSYNPKTKNRKKDVEVRIIYFFFTIYFGEKN